MSMRDDTLLLRRFRLPPDVSIEDLSRDVRPTTTQGLDPIGGLPQPPALNRQVQSVYDARLPFTREFIHTVRIDSMTTSATGLAFTDFTFTVPNGYLGVWRRFKLLTFFSNGQFNRGYYTTLLQGQPVSDVSGAGNVDAGQRGIPFKDSALGLDEENFWTDYYLEVPPGGSFGLRLFVDFPLTVYTVGAIVSVSGQYVRAENVPPELQIAQPPQVTPVVPAEFKG